MSPRYWFTAKEYGWGWVPATWEGWTVTGIYVLVLLAWALYVFKFSKVPRGRRSIWIFVVGVVVISGLCTLVAWTTGEPPRWRWGS